MAGDTIRVVIAEESQEAALDALRRERVRLISVTPVRTSLEEYFIAQLSKPAEVAATPVVSEAKSAGARS